MSQTTISRESVLQLGKSGKPWAFLAMMRQIGSAADGEPAIVFAHAANLAKLGLKELAAERLRILPPAVKAMAEVKGLADAVEAMSFARVPREEMLRNFDASGLVLVARGIAAESDVVRWRGFLEEAIERTAVYRATDGNVLIDGATPEDAKARARELIGSDGRDEYPAALMIENLLPPWLLVEAAERWKKNAQGFWRRLMVVHEDEKTVGLGLAVADVSGILAQERVKVFVGAGAPEGVKKFLDEQRGEMLVARLISLREVDQKESTLANIVINGTDAQLEELKELKERVEARYAPRGKAQWAQRYREAMQGGKPLRVLVPTTRYSTFLQHSSRDIVDAFKAIGHEAKLLIESEDCSTLAANAYWRAFDEFDPDLVVLINFPRPLRMSTTPANVPYVTWLQDAMPHLFDPAIAQKLGEFDFACGYLFNELFLLGDWDATRAIASPVVVNPRKFHAGAVPGLEQFECDVAFVSNHSETPEQMRARHLQMAATSGVPRACVEELHSLAADAVNGIHQRGLWSFAPARFEEICARYRLGEESRANVRHLYFVPMASEIFRHEALEWANEICKRRGWKFNLYGKGWEKHPEFGSHAQGTVKHGEELRGVYQKAKVHLHLDLNTLMHQRVSECFLSGGLILSRLFADVLDVDATLAEQAMMHVVGEEKFADGRQAWVVSRHEPLRKHNELRAALGIPARFDDGLWPEPRVSKEKYAKLPVFEGSDAARMLGDLKELTFADRAGLEWLLARAIEEPGFRERKVEEVRPRIQGVLTHDVMCGRLLKLISGHLGS